MSNQLVITEVQQDIKRILGLLYNQHLHLWPYRIELMFFFRWCQILLTDLHALILSWCDTKPREINYLVLEELFSSLESLFHIQMLQNAYLVIDYEYANGRQLIEGWHESPQDSEGDRLSVRFCLAAFLRPWWGGCYAEHDEELKSNQAVQTQTWWHIGDKNQTGFP